MSNFLNSINNDDIYNAAVEFVESADSRQTSPELMEAIFQTAGFHAEAAVSLWENGPTDAELVSIIEIVTNKGQNGDTTDYVWGAEGSSWAAAPTFQV